MQKQLAGQGGALLMKAVKSLASVYFDNDPQSYRFYHLDKTAALDQIL